ncbi:uncharacterized protein LOC144648396 [Oculina patagonica]
MISRNELPPSAKNVIVTTPCTSRFYLLPKIHKPNNPGRPIVSACNCPTENIAALLDEVMSPLVANLTTYVKDTNHALEIFDSFEFNNSNPDERFLFTMDVKSLYTVIPNDCGLQALCYFLVKRPVLEPPTSTLTRLAELVLTLNAFSFNNQHYRQVGGVAMGSRMGPNYACLFVGYMEEQILSTYTGFIPQLHKRYIDDIVGAASCRREELEDFITHVSTYHPALQFKHTISQTQLPFLDITLSISGSKICTSAYYKETDTHNYLHYTSSHPQHCKNSIPYTQFLRLRRLCSEDDDFVEKCEEMTTFFADRGYPSDLLCNDRERVNSISRQEALEKRVRQSEERIPLVLTYHPLSSGIKHILLNNFNILMSDPTTAAIFPAPPIVAYRRNCSLRDLLVHTSYRCATDQQGTFACEHPRCRTCQYTTSDVHVHGPKCSTTIHEHFNCKSENIVYCISCRRCSRLYIGETGRSLRERFGEHLRSVEKNTPSFPVAEHFNSPSHTLSDIEVRGLRMCSGSGARRKQIEMESILKLGSMQPLGLNNAFHFI